MYELKRITAFAESKLQAGRQVIFATIVKTEGSSYRKKWTQMVVADDLEFAGHLSGGCVEKEVLRQAQMVFASGKNVLFPYDGTYRLGCKGIIYVLLEIIDKDHFNAAYEQIKICEAQRLSFKQGIEDLENDLKQTFFQFEGKKTKYYLNKKNEPVNATALRTILPQKQVIIIGSEFDSDQLSKLAHQLGYQVTQIVGLNYTIPKNTAYPVIYVEPEMLAEKVKFDKRTAVLLMTHTYSRDLHFVQILLKEDVAYIGTLGPKQRKAEMINYLFEHFANLPDTQPEVLDKIGEIKGPIGINIPSKTPEEIAVAVLAQLVEVFNEEKMDKSIQNK